MNATAQTGTKNTTTGTNNIPPSYPTKSESIVPDVDKNDANPDFYRVVSSIKEGNKTLIVEVHEIRDVGTIQRDILIMGDATTMQVTFLQGLRPIFVEDGTVEYLRVGVLAMGETQSRLR